MDSYRPAISGITHQRHLTAVCMSALTSARWILTSRPEWNSSCPRGQRWKPWSVRYLTAQRDPTPRSESDKWREKHGTGECKHAGLSPRCRPVITEELSGPQMQGYTYPVLLCVWKADRNKTGSNLSSTFWASFESTENGTSRKREGCDSVTVERLPHPSFRVVPWLRSVPPGLSPPASGSHIPLAQDAYSLRLHPCLAFILNKIILIKYVKYDLEILRQI